VEKNQAEPIYAIGCFIPRPGSPSSYSNQPYLWAKFKVDYYSLDFGQLSSTDPNRGLWYKSKSAWYKPEMPSPTFQSVAEKDLGIVERCLKMREQILTKTSAFTKDGEKFVFHVKIDDMEEFADEESLAFIAANAGVFLNMLSRDLFDDDKLKLSIKSLKQRLSKRNAVKPLTSSSTSSSASGTASNSRPVDDIVRKDAKPTTNSSPPLQLDDNLMDFDDDGDDEYKPNSSITKSKPPAATQKTSSKPASTNSKHTGRLLPRSESASEMKKRVQPVPLNSSKPQSNGNSSASIPPSNEIRIKKKKIDDDDENLDYAPAPAPATAPVPAPNSGDKFRTIALGRDKLANKHPRDKTVRYISGTKPTFTMPSSSKFIPGATNAASRLPSYHMNHRPQLGRTNSAGSSTSMDSPSYAVTSPSVEPFATNWIQVDDSAMAMEIETSPALLNQPQPNDNWSHAQDPSSPTYNLGSPNAYTHIDSLDEVAEANGDTALSNAAANKYETTAIPEAFTYPRNLTLYQARFNEFYLTSNRHDNDRDRKTSKSKRVTITNKVTEHRYSPLRESSSDDEMS
jgi:hypothetical protein